MEEPENEITIHEVFNPFSLCEQCINICVEKPHETLLLSYDTECLVDLENITDYDEVHSTEKYKTTYKLRMPLYLPSNLWEMLFQKIVKKHPEQYIQAFSDQTKCRLTKLNLSLTHTKDILQDHKLTAKFFHHPLKEIILKDWDITPYTLNSLQYCNSTLAILDLSSVSGLKHFTTLKDLKNLVKLNLKNTDIDFSKHHMKYIGSLPNLTWLDLSHTSVDDSSLQDLGKLEKTLQWLSLYQCVHITNEDCLRNVLQKLSNLVHLDVSKNPKELTNENELPYPIVNNNLMETFAKMPKLESLDISGSSGLKMVDLSCFTNINKKLKFLGLCNTEGLSHATSIPAEKVTGEANEEQILTSLEVYPDRVKFISNGLRKLFSLASQHQCSQLERCMKLIVKSMRSFKKNSGIQIAATASLYHLSREDDPANTNAELRRDIIMAILESMEHNEGVLQLQKNSCLTLCNFKIPIEVEFQYFRVAKLLLTAIKTHSDDYLRRIAIMLFNAIVCQNAESRKKEIGLKFAIQIIMKIIREKIASTTPDTLMETCWSALWNITDETPGNCADFLENGGMELFMECLSIFPQALELHRNMMGLMGNVAEVKELRPQLMKDGFIQLFVSLLSTNPDTLEVSYNSAGLLSHMLSDGEEAWTITSLTRDECMTAMIDCIDSWNVNSARNINYRSFKPIISLLGCFYAPAAQQWAAWALANLTKILPHKYCKLVEQEGGLDALGKILDNPHVRIRIKELSAMAVDSCRHELCFR